MSDKDWWHNYSHFSQWKRCPSRPDPAEVLLCYMNRRGIRPEEHTTYLMDLLGLQKSMVYSILNGNGGLDSISRCRRLIQALKIYPPLLGIDAKFYPIELYPLWWHDYGFSFHADAEGYPDIHEVIAYLRVQRTQEEGGRVKLWSQEDLGDATGLKKETVYRMEHDRNPLILDHMSRRAMIASALGTLAADFEPTLFRLFGLDPQAYRVPVPASLSLLPVSFSTRQLTGKMLDEYHQKLSVFFTEYDTSHGQDIVMEALEWVQQLPAMQPRATTIAEIVNLLALQLFLYLRILTSDSLIP